MEAKFKIIFLVSIFFIIGIFVGSFGLNYLNNHEFEDFDLYMLNDIERMSYNYHREFKSKAAGEAHSTYLLYSHRVWRAGRISDIDYHLHQAIGNLRFCISLEQREKYDYAKISCELAENQFNQLDKKNSFKEFRNIVDSEYFTLDML